MPLVILGTWYLSNLPGMPFNGRFPACPLCNSIAHKTVSAWLLEAGGRGLDTAFDYQNQQGIGQAIRESSVPRKDIFIVSKVPGTLGYDKTLKYVRRDLDQLGVEHIELLLLHFCNDIEAEPIFRHCSEDSVLESWRALEDLHRNGTLRGIGVSNFCIGQLEPLMAQATVKPMVNQVERHPGYTQDAMVAYAQQHGMTLICYEPLAARDWCPNGMLLAAHSELKTIAQRHGASQAQVLLRWQVQSGVAVNPRVGGLLHPLGPNIEHMQQNLAVMSPDAFNLSVADMAVVAGLHAVSGDNFFLNKCSPVGFCPENNRSASVTLV